MMADGLDRETALQALQHLADADRLIAAKLHTKNDGRRETIDAMCAALGVRIKEG